MDSNFPVPQPNPNRFHNWIIAVIVAIAIVVLLMFFYVIRRRQAVRNRTYDPTPTRIESGFNRDCKNIIQQSHLCSCNDVMVQ
ncbi:hypothetical protein AX14_013676 [Amanita brunnescens Koide BX004]|nr:hypothetical protein AX14_013676 [Amanita brunnescens Koide BX004]